MSLNKVAVLTKVHPSTVKNIMKKEEMKAIMESEQLRLATIVPKAVSNMEYWVDNATNTKDPQLIDIGYKATKDILQSQGLLADNPSLFSKVTINQQINIIPPIIAEVLKKYGEELRLNKSETELCSEGEVIDVEVEEEEERQEEKEPGRSSDS